MNLKIRKNPVTNTLWIPASVADAAAVNHNGISTPLANNLFNILITGKPTFLYGQRSLQINPLICISLEIFCFDKFILVEELYWKNLNLLY